MACEHRQPVDNRLVPLVNGVEIAAPTPDASADAAVAIPDPVDPGYAGRVLGWVTDTTNRLVRMRHLPLQRTFARSVLSHTQMVDALRRTIHASPNAADFPLDGELAHHLGFIGPASDLESLTYWLMEGQLAGFYDPRSQSLVVGGWIDRNELQLVLAHEITHALQDQAFDLTRLMSHARGSGDRNVAMATIIEGDATVTAIEDLFERHGVTLMRVPPSRVRAAFQQISPSATRLRAAPHALREATLFPYREGTSLCLAAWRSRGFAGIDALVRNPPVSTEQVLHPDKFAAREAPIVVNATVPPSLASAFALAYDEVEGELGLRMFLQPTVGDASAASGGRGWGGDRAVLLLPSAQHPAAGAWPRESYAAGMLVWTIVFDGESDATRFDGLARRVLDRRFTGSQHRDVARTMRVYSTSDGHAGLIARSGRTVVVLDNAPEALAETAAREAIAAAHR